MADKESPFGYRYVGNSVTIKLRLLENKFFKHGINKYGSYRYTQKGYIIFVAMLDAGSTDFKELTTKLRELKQDKAG